MSKKIIIISSTPRKGGNSEKLAQAFAKGAIENGNIVEIINLREMNINYCKGCFACARHGQCIIADDAAAIITKIHDADITVFATPIYFYSISGQLKTLLDRTNPLYGKDYMFKKVYLLATAAEEKEETIEGAVKDIQGWTKCFERAEFSGSIFAGGVNNIGDIIGHAALEQAYQKGKNI